ncbi:hypothetical protein HOD08_04685 [bacterium]|jgi:hypothetical protein|nr:hypothetical protein [bacterium]
MKLSKLLLLAVVPCAIGVVACAEKVTEPSEPVEEIATVEAPVPEKVETPAPEKPVVPVPSTPEELPLDDDIEVASNDLDDVDLPEDFDIGEEEFSKVLEEVSAMFEGNEESLQELEASLQNVDFGDMFGELSDDDEAGQPGSQTTTG